MNAQAPGTGQRPHHEGLTAAGRAVEQHTTWRVDAEPGEGIRMLQRPQHGLGERLLRLDHVADIVESDRADRDFFGVRPRQRPDDGQRAGEIILGQRRRLTVLAGTRRGPQCRLAHQSGEIRSHEAGCAVRDGV